MEVANIINTKPHLPKNTIIGKITIILRCPNGQGQGHDGDAAGYGYGGYPPYNYN